MRSFPTIINVLLRSFWLARHCLKTDDCSIGWSKIFVVKNEDCKELALLNFLWNDDEHKLMLGCGVKQNLQLLLQEMKSYLQWIFFHISEVCFASLIYWGHLLVPCKFKLHHFSSKLCHFVALKLEPHHLSSEWCCFTSCLWNLDDVNFLRNDDRLYIWSRCGIISPLWACSYNVKILGGMFRHL